MSEKFDPYHQWLGIPASEQPPHHYRLLSIPLFEESPAVIENAADRQMAHLRTFQSGQYSALSQKLLNEVATAKVCLLNPAKKTAYDQSLRQKLRPTTLPTAQPLPDYSQAGLAEVFETRMASASATASKRRGKKSQPKPAAIITVAALTVAAVGFAVWVTIGHDREPSDGEIAKVAAPTTSAKPLKEVLPKSPGPSKTETPIVASTEPKRTSKADDPKAAPEPKPPEPKAEEETTATPKADKTVEAKPAANDAAADKAEPNEKSATAKKLVPPSAEEQKRLVGEIDEIYKPGGIKDQVGKAALARKLLDDGRKNEANRAEQFVLLRRTGEIARDAGEADLMLEAVDAIVAAGFDIRPFPVKARLLKQLAAQSSADGASRLSVMSESCVKFALQAAAGGATNEASDVLDTVSKSLLKSISQAQTAQRTAKAALARARTPAEKAERETKVAEAQAELDAVKSAQSVVAQCAKGLQQARRDYEAIQAARERLKSDPDDAAACLAVGRWYCFDQGDWDEGLKLLAKGSDAALKSLAAEELSLRPSTGEQRVAQGDRWWDLAEKAAGKSKIGMRLRAAHWYQEAMPDLPSGLAKSKAEKRLAEMADEPVPEAIGRSERIRPPPATAPFNGRMAKRHQARWAKYLGVPVIQTNSIGMKLALIPPGEFEMGSPKELIEEELRLHGDETGYRDRLPGEAPRHRVRITKPYWVGTTDVTQGEYERVTGRNPSNFKGDPKRPVETVGWDGAVAFCRQLSELPGEKAAKRRYELPTEAQWEYACRAGSTTRFWFGDDERLFSEYGWCNKNSGGETHPVAQKPVNPWGLYDMGGNVWQWCQDWYAKDYYANSPTDDPRGAAGGPWRVHRGGSWQNEQWFCRSAFHPPCHPAVCYCNLGFRVALVPLETAAERAKTSRANDAAQASGGATASKPSPAVASADSQSPVPLPGIGSFVGADGKWKLPPGAPLPAISPFNEKTAKQHQARWAKYLRVPVVQANSIGMKLVLIPPGEFMMGSPKELIEEELKAHDDDKWYKERLAGEGPQRQIRVTKPYWLGVTDVTQEEYQRVMGSNPSKFPGDPKRPVEQVSWEQAAEFCEKLSSLPEEKAAKRRYELPTEAQWEYACRAGTTTRWYSGDDEAGLVDVAWFNTNAGGQTHPVGQKRPNVWGLYDMQGNVWNWCQDWYDKDYYAKSGRDDPAGPPGGSNRVIRGGNWDDIARACRSALRNYFRPGGRDYGLGLRVSRVLADK